MINFQNDLKDTTIQLLDHYGVRYKKKDNLFDLLIKLYTFFEKYITPQKRMVSYSVELQSKINKLPVATQEALSKTESWISKGVDVNPYQSRGLYGEGSRDYQNSLYGIVHLHLSAKQTDVAPVMYKDRFAKPSDYLLFALFRKGTAFFIDVVQHPQTLSKKNPRVPDWTSPDLLKIIERNWPFLLVNSIIPAQSLTDGNGNEIVLTDGDIAEATVNGMTVPIRGNKGLYFPQMGVSASGSNTKATIMAQKEIQNAVICQDHFLKHEEEIRTIFRKQLTDVGIQIPREFDFHYDYIPELKHHLIVDRNTGVAFDVFTGDWYTPV